MLVEVIWRAAVAQRTSTALAAARKKTDGHDCTEEKAAETARQRCALSSHSSAKGVLLRPTTAQPLNKTNDRIHRPAQRRAPRRRWRPQEKEA